MALIKRGRVWNYDFRYNGIRYQGTTQHTNKEEAAKWVRAFRTNLVNTGVGLVQKAQAPILSTFLEGVFLDSARQNAKTVGTRKFYEQRVKVLCSYPPFTTLTLDKVGELAVQGYKDSRLAKKMAVASINAELSVLRKALIFADTCGLCRYQKVHSLPGAKSREFVLSGELEKIYLAAAPYPLKQAAILMLDLGLRPGECVALRKDAVTTGGVKVRQGKTANAIRTLPQTERTREVFELCTALHPDSPWVFPGLKGGHYTRTALEKLHTALRREKNLPAEFVLHSLRHTFATRLAESTGGDVFVLMKALGHSSPKVCSKYVHPSADYLSLAMKRLEGYGRLLRGEVEAHRETSPEKSSTS